MHIHRVTTHRTPDTDAFTSAAALWWCLAPGATPLVVFDSSPDATAHCPREGRYVVDVGRGELDHHQFTDPRSACAFGLVLDYIETHGDAAQRARAAQLRPLVPLIMRQDSTGRMFDDRAVQRQALPALLNDMVWWHQDDDAAWADAWEIISRVFDAVAIGHAAERAVLSVPQILIANGAQDVAERIVMLVALAAQAGQIVEDDPEGVCAHSGVTVSARVASFTVTRTVGRFEPDIIGAIERAYPDVLTIVSETTWLHRDGHVISVSRNVGRTRAGKHLDCRLLHQQRRQALPHFVPELALWHAEPWFTGTGSLKFPRPTAPPPGCIHAVAETLRIMTTAHQNEPAAMVSVIPQICDAHDG
jgi:hypothetical protein